MDEPHASEPREPVVSASDIEAMTTWTLIRVGRHLERLLGEVLTSHGLTPQQYGILAHLSARPALTQAELAGAVLMRPQSMQHQLARLEALELIERPAPRGRGQPSPVRLSTQGRATLRRANEQIRSANSDSSLHLDAAEHAALDEVAHRLLQVSSLAPEQEPFAGGPRSP